MTKRARVGGAVVAAVTALLLAACGGDEQDTTAATQSERAFLEAMVPHHESAVEMARMALERGRHARVRQLARAIVVAQRREIRRMQGSYRRLFGERLPADHGGHRRLGLSAEEAGMGHAGDMALVGARPFDKAFIDAMIPHHQGAIRMARAVLADSRDRRIAELAESIISAQANEIEQMNTWRTDWYGGPSPAGGVPAGASASGGGMDGMGGKHDGH